ncbi:MAG: hypothetical protein RJA36_2860 [Pseudomonadota bacterium]|jgi:hemerythrin-like domain-containing protein
MSIPQSLRIIRDEHAALSSVLQSMLLLRQGPGEDSRRFFDSLSAMLLYIDEFPEQLHHRKETELLFPLVLRAAPETREAIARLDGEHEKGAPAVRELQHLLLAWRFLGASRRQPFVDALTRYVAFYREHMRLEESEILLIAQAVLTAQDWAALDAAFGLNQDPLAGQHSVAADYQKLFSLIVHDTPTPIGLGA